ncbi:HNH endonuclease domain-containing protein [Mycoplasma leonicaptivi]|uniref:HNH endonuclease domain-containing protein n=1 Tax=Mycoplasma leonicaptivi TaxID=36742 RepID=UPI0004828E0F|nr:HNH endonuclease domain-containing protein [Mycoplasma leonicaptivi]
MDINKQNAQKLWKERYGNKKVIRDYTRYEIHFDQYGTETEFGWDVDHIIPLSRNGSGRKTNLVICHHLTNNEKENKTSWWATLENGDEVRLQVTKGKIKNQDTDEILYDSRWYN